MNRTSFILLFVWVLPVVVWSQTTVGNEFQVNTYTTSYQRNPSVAMDADRNFVVVWDSYDQDGSGRSEKRKAEHEPEQGEKAQAQIAVRQDE